MIVRRQDQKLCASITYMIRHYVSPKGAVIFDHPHNAELRALGQAHAYALTSGARRAIPTYISASFPLGGE